MKRMSKMLVILTLLALVLSVPAFAAADADFDWGKNKDNRKQWGLVYLLEYDEDGSFPEEGSLKGYTKINDKDGPRYTDIVGPYIKDGQNVTTRFGIRLDANYSPYIAKFDGSNRILGVRVWPFVFDFGPVTLTLDGTYAFSAVVDKDKKDFWDFELAPRTTDILLDAALEVAGLNLDIAALRYEKKNTEDEDRLYDYYYNVAAEAAMEVIPGLNVTGLYAYYSEYKDWLYEVTGEYEVLPETLWVRAGHRNSEFEDVEGKTYDKLAVVGGYKADEKTQRYIGNLDPLKDLYNRDKSFNVGATYIFDYSGADTTLDVDYDTTNPAQRGDLDDKVTVTADTKYLGYSLWQRFSIMFPDEATESREDIPIADSTANRLDYFLKFKTPEYDLPVPMVDRVFAVGKLNLDWDQNYVADSRMQVIPAVELGVEQDVWRLEGMTFGAILAYDMFKNAPEDLELDPFKYALIARYDAPNGIMFRLEYQNSADYTNETKLIHNKKLNDRYGDIRFYGNSKFHGIRLSVGFPL